VSDENAAVAEAEQVVRDHRDRLKAVMLMEVQRLIHKASRVA